MNKLDDNNKKRPRGRPPIAGQAGKRYQVYLPVNAAQKLRVVGDGSLSRGIVNLSKQLSTGNA